MDGPDANGPKNPPQTMTCLGLEDCRQARHLKSKHFTIAYASPMQCELQSFS